MLQSIHDRVHGWIASIVLGLVILSFAGWGIHSYLDMSDASGIAAKVNGKTISRQSVGSAFQRLQRQLLQAGSKSGYQPSPQTDAQLRKNVLQELVNASIMSQALKKAGYRTDESQLEAMLQSIPQFQQDGRFSPQRFAMLLADTHYSMQGFLEDMSTSLLAQQLEQGIQFGALALPEEVTQMAGLLGQQRDLGYLLIPPSLFANQNLMPSESAVNQYYQQHAKQFEQPAKISLDYVELTVNTIASSIHPDDAALQRFYSANQEMFNQNGQPQPFASVRAQVTAALSHQQAQTRFATSREQLASLTYEHADSLQPAAQALGLTIAHSAEFTQQMGSKDDISANNTVREAAFSPDVLRNHNNSDVISLNPEQVVVVRIRHYQPAAPMPLEKVRSQIVASLQEAARNQQLQELAAKVQAALIAGHSTPEQLATQYHLQWQRTGWISQQDKDKKIDDALIAGLFQISAATDGQPLPHWSMVQMPKGAGYAVIGLFGVKAGPTPDRQQAQQLAQQLQAANALLEFRAYQASLVSNAQVDIVNNTGY